MPIFNLQQFVTFAKFLFFSEPFAKDDYNCGGREKRLADREGSHDKLGPTNGSNTRTGLKQLPTISITKIGL